jgi:hypothetical protein
MTETVFVPISADDDDAPISKDGITQLINASLAAVGHASALRYLSDQIEAAFASGNTREVSQIMDLLEFTTLELQDASEKAECLVRSWGDHARQTKRKAGQTSGEAGEEAHGEPAANPETEPVGE